MGRLIDGVWHDQWYDTRATRGRFVRPPTQFRNVITPDGRFRPAKGRYHLYVSLACPWAHRTLIFRKLKGLEDAISVSVTHWLMGDQGWSFEPGPGVIPDPNGARFLHEIYTRADPHYSGRATVPVLWDKEQGTIVNNESAEIIRAFNTAFDTIGAAAGDYYPPELRDEIEAVNARIYDTVNNGVYKAGFATGQEAYEGAVGALFDTLDWLEQRLAGQAWLCGGRITEADWRLFTTLVRFDSVYFGHFKCNLRRIVDYPNLWDYVRALYQVGGVRETVDIGHIKRHYYMSHTSINPNRIVPLGPMLDFELPSRRPAAVAAR
ncbi:MAG: glutathione S-transferase family protein [Alphaproteobacteria bacterium]|nr:glutathione S-transferase family protein [Alphaproteobacteria bacterium]